jgi:uncharacterized SAM-binding protein YcdF (DUF218 family)
LSGARRSTISRPVHRNSKTSVRSRWQRKPRWFLRISLASFGLIAALLIWAVAARALAPKSNTSRQSFDAIIVLGTTPDSDGNPTPELLDRITEGVGEYQRGVAPRIIVTGAAAHNKFVEAEVMARVAQAQGVPASQIIEEPHALDTIQNACYSTRILSSHGWHSAEVISSTYHLPRAAMIFSHLPLGHLEWRMHAASANLTPAYYSNAAGFVETLKTARYLAWARWVESCTL